MRVALLGASDNQERFAYKSYKKLTAAGHQVFLLHPRLTDVEGAAVYKNLKVLPQAPDVITLYIGPSASRLLGPEILQSGAKRVIFNPGTENPALEEALKAGGLSVTRDCTLMMLDEGRF